jgi:hypothetical protein
LLISDACGKGFTLPDQVELIRIGDEAENVGIVAADLQPAGPGELQLFLQLASTLPEPREVELALKHEGRPSKLITRPVEPGLNPPWVQTIDGGPGRWSATLAIDDALNLDNTVYLFVPPPRPVRVRVSMKRPYFLEHSILAFEQATGLLKLVQDEGAADVVVTEGQVPDAPLSVVFQPAVETAWWHVEPGSIDVVAPRSQIPDHPMLRHLDISMMTFNGAQAVQLSDGALVLVESESHEPLLWEATRENRTVLVVNMDLGQSDFFLSVQFPVLVYNAVTHLTGRSTSLSAVYPTASRAALPGAREGSPSAVTPPHAEPITVTGTKSPRLDRCGFYSVENDRGHWSLAASVLAKEETQLQCPDILATARPVARGRSASYWLLSGALAVILIESLLYHRRKVG